MTIEVMESDLRESLEPLTKEQVIEMFIALAVKHDAEYLAKLPALSDGLSGAAAKLGLFMIIWHMNSQTKKKPGGPNG